MAEGKSALTTPRYRSFIHVDAESLDSVLNANPHETGWVNVVDAFWRPEETGEGIAFELNNRGEPFDKIESQRTRNVGWSRVAPSYLLSTFLCGAAVEL